MFYSLVWHPKCIRLLQRKVWKYNCYRFQHRFQTEKVTEIIFAFEAETVTHYPGARFSVHLCLDASRGSVFYVASNAKLISVTRRPYYGLGPLLYTMALVFQTASVYLTVVITIERFVAVCYPFKAREFCTRGVNTTRFSPIIIGNTFNQGGRSHLKLSPPAPWALSATSLDMFYTVQYI